MILFSREKVEDVDGRFLGCRGSAGSTFLRRVDGIKEGRPLSIGGLNRAATIATEMKKLFAS